MGSLKIWSGQFFVSKLRAQCGVSDQSNRIDEQPSSGRIIPKRLIGLPNIYQFSVTCPMFLKIVEYRKNFAYDPRSFRYAASDHHFG